MWLIVPPAAPHTNNLLSVCFFFQAEDGIRDGHVTGVQTCALPICTDAAPVRLEATIDDGSQAITREFTATVQPMPSDPDQDEAYVWAFFTGEGVGGEKISLAASRGNDALDWNTLNDGEIGRASGKGKSA